MGVTCVSQWPVPDGKSGQQAVEMLQRRLEATGATKAGSFCVDCETYMSGQSITPSKTAHVMHNTEHPLTCFAIMDSGTCLVADSNFDQLMTKLKGFYTPRKGAKIEVKGPRYEYVDFIVKIGTVTTGPTASSRGILVEVEYTPCVVPNDCWSLLTEFMGTFMGDNKPPVPQVLANKMDGIYAPTDTILQYLEHFNNYRKSTGNK
ncbi:MED20 [Branchiostoma lanceolatum]|uniref:Mediator of RNA polymerase II transcription subunit 20 n=2 Tax=Branchiostoma lanceolatum TaxID=7740 RepID=A0A8K0ERW1_BRALA|nr:MED20 [Branchiostoma lanceolatum]